MLTFLHVLFAVLTIGLALFGLITENFEYQHFMLISMGLMILITGIKGLRKEKKAFAYFMILTAAFILFVAIDVLLIS